MPPDHDFSRANNEKLERILQLLEGNGPDSPGLVARVAAIERILYGRENSGGMVAEFNRIRRFNTWVWSTASALAGGGMAVAIQYASKHL